MPSKTKKTVVGSRVQAKARNVTSESEAKRRYGINWDTKMVQGTVTKAFTKPSTTGKTQGWQIEAEYEFDGPNSTVVKKTATLNIRSVKDVLPPTPVVATTIAAAAAAGQIHEPLTTSNETNNALTEARRLLLQAGMSTSQSQNSSTLQTPQTHATAGGQVLAQIAATTTPTTQADVTLQANSMGSPPEMELGHTATETNTSTATTSNTSSPAGSPMATTRPTATRTAGAATTAAGTTATRAAGAATTAAAECHGLEWFDNITTPQDELNGDSQETEWRVKSPDGTCFSNGSDNDEEYSRLDYFLLMFPPKLLTDIVVFTNEQLSSKGLKTTTKGEIIKLFGIMVLATRYEFGTRASLWSQTSEFKYSEAPQFGTKTGMSRRRFDLLWQHIRFGNQPKDIQDGMSHEAHRWLLVDNHVKRFNEHRAAVVTPSGIICVDESISRWYGLGGLWINIGLPMYVAIDRKPENGCEIQDSADGECKLHLRVLLVKGQEEETFSTTEDSQGLNHGTQVLKELLDPWLKDNGPKRTVVGDSYFASVNALPMNS